MAVKARESGNEGRLVRAFVAVTLPPERRARAAAIQERLRGPAGIKWVDPDTFHFTLRFLGPTEPTVLDALSQSLQALAAGQPRFSIALAGVGAFPSVRRPQAIWIGVTQGAAELQRLADQVEEAAVRLGFEAERRPFRPHLTIGRVKAERAPAELVRALEAEPADECVGTVTVDEVVLMRSDLRPGGPIYTPLAVFPLRDEDGG